MRDKLNEYKSVEALSMTITHHLCTDNWRTRRQTLSIEEAITSDSPTSTPDKLLEEKDGFQLMKKIIDSLPPLQRTIIHMKDVEGYESEEIAEITGCNPEAIRSNLSRARKKVRELYLQAIQQKERRIKS